MTTRYLKAHTGYRFEEAKAGRPGAATTEKTMQTYLTITEAAKMITAIGGLRMITDYLAAAFRSQGN